VTVSSRAGSAKVGTTSGLSTGIADLVAPNLVPTVIGAVTKQSKAKQSKVKLGEGCSHQIFKQ